MKKAKYLSKKVTAFTESNLVSKFNVAHAKF